MSLDRSVEVRFDRVTKSGNDMNGMQKLLATAVASIAGMSQERAVESLFEPGGTPCRSTRRLSSAGRRSGGPLSARPAGARKCPSFEPRTPNAKLLCAL